MMSRMPVAKPLSQQWHSSAYDIFIAALGFEARARYIGECYRPSAKKYCAVGFNAQQVLSYGQNKRWFNNAGYEIHEVGDGDFADWCGEMLAGIGLDRISVCRLCIDISSLSRLRLAVLIQSMRRLDWAGLLAVDFVYSIGRYSRPAHGDVPNVHVGPVLPSFAGWSVDPEQPSTAIVGLGHEENKALGAVEHLQASDVWTFAPYSPIREYERSAQRANRILLESIPTNRRLDYRVERPFECFVNLESLVFRCLRTSSPVVFPFGPKIFALNALLVGSLYPSVAVWRVSGGENEKAVQRVASEFVCGLSVDFEVTDALPTNTVHTSSQGGTPP